LLLGTGTLAAFPLLYALAVWKVGKAFRRRRVRLWHYGLIFLLAIAAWAIFALLDLLIPWTELPPGAGPAIHLAMLALNAGLITALVFRAPARIRMAFILAFCVPLAVMTLCPWNTRKALQWEMVKIRPGMTEREVKEKMKGREFKKLDPPFGAGELIIQHPDQRRDDSDAISISFDQDKKVQKIEFVYD
jgi:hypothetical protein